MLRIAKLLANSLSDMERRVVSELASGRLDYHPTLSETLESLVSIRLIETEKGANNVFSLTELGVLVVSYLDPTEER